MAPASTLWTRPAIDIILIEWRKRKSLYDQSHADYLNRSKRQICLEGICKVLLEKLDIKVSVEELKSKIQILRSQFNKDLRGIVKNKKYRPKFWCFNKLEWLKPYINNRYNSSPYRLLPSNTTSRTISETETTQAITNDKQINETTAEFEEPSLLNQSDMTSTTTEPNGPPNPSSSILTSKLVEAVLDEPNNEHDLEDIHEQFYETIALTQQIVQNRVAAKELKTDHDKSKTHISWEGEFVTSQLNLISDETIRSDTMWEIQCVLRRGIEQDRVLPRRRRKKNRRPSLTNSEVSDHGSCISLDSKDSERMNNGV